MADALDSKSSESNLMRVQVPPPVLQSGKGLGAIAAGCFGDGVLASVTQSVTQNRVFVPHCPKPGVSVESESPFKVTSHVKRFGRRASPVYSFFPEITSLVMSDSTSAQLNRMVFRLSSISARGCRRKIGAHPVLGKEPLIPFPAFGHVVLAEIVPPAFELYEGLSGALVESVGRRFWRGPGRHSSTSLLVRGEG